MLEREAAKLALDLNQAQSAFQSLSAGVQQHERDQASTQEACYRTDASLTAARGQVAELNLASERTRGRLELQSKQIASIEERLAAGEAETQDLDARHQREKTDLEAHAQTLVQLEAESVSVRESLQSKTTERDGLQNDLRQREQGIESSRQQVLKLLGEASTLRNQLAQIEEYLAGMERDVARSKREEEAALADMTRMEQVKAEISARLGARQMERKDSLEEILSHRAYTTESVKRLFTAIEHGQIEGFKPSGVLADFVEVTDPAWEKACETFLHEELE